jgi:hypothetical protein
MITLSPMTPSVQSPLDLARSDDLSLSSSLQLTCDVFFSLIHVWSLSSCSPRCSSSFLLPSSVVTTSSELFIPSNLLSYGIYEVTLTVSMLASSNWTGSSSIYVHIHPSDITVNLVPYGTSMICHDYRLNLTLDPGAFSLDPDVEFFNSSVSC